MRRLLYRIIVILLVMIPGWSEATSAVKILILGDSLSAAYNMPLEQGWVSLLQRRIDKIRPGMNVINASISGETAANAVNRLPRLMAEYDPDLVVIELGGNDGMRGFKLQQIERNLQQLIDIARRNDAGVVITGIQLHPNYGPRYNDLFMRMFTKLAKKNKTGPVPFILDGIGDHPAKMQEDGIHPSTGAQPEVLDNMWPAIEAALKTLK